MKIKRWISALLCGTLLATVLTTSVFAKTFSDVENDPTVSWAKTDINEMTNLGYIKGYEDGTYKPQRAVSKIETLILMSRILGVEDSEYGMSVEWANSEYSATVNAINTTYVDELSYLMYFNVLDLTDLRNFASSANANTSLLRWQAAYLMVKFADMENMVESVTLKESMYSDYASIPENARAYVAIAAEEGFMQGMGNDDNGKSYFSPETTLTRAQMATLLNRMIKKMDRYFIHGMVASVDADQYNLVVDDNGKKTTCNATPLTTVKVDGQDLKFSHIGTQSEVMVTYTFDKVRLIETLPDEESSSIYGIVTQTSDNAKGQQITVKDSENESYKMTYTFAPSCSFYIKGNRGSFGDIKVGNNVRLVLTGANVTECYVVNKNTEEIGTFVSIDSDDYNTYITVNDEVSNDIDTFTLSIDGVKVTRNGREATLRELAIDDSLTLYLTYGKVVEIIAKSQTSDELGTIKEIVLSDTPEITLTVNGKDRTYYLTSKTAVKVNGVEATIYDLRPGNSATVVIDGSTIASIESSAVSSSGKTQVAGKVASINTTLKVISVTNANGGTDTVYYESGTTFLKTSGKAATAKDIVQGTNITATGNDSTGYFVATIIIVD